jgi:hypothetical protein
MSYPSNPADFQTMCNVNCPGDTPFTQAQFNARTASMPYLQYVCSYDQCEVNKYGMLDHSWYRDSFAVSGGGQQANDFCARHKITVNSTDDIEGPVRMQSMKFENGRCVQDVESEICMFDPTAASALVAQLDLAPS